MKLPPLLLAAPLALAVLGTDLSAQCDPVGGAVFASYGSSCGPGFEPTTLTGVYSPVNCTVDLSLNTPAFGFNVFLEARMLVLGLQADATPLPIPGQTTQGCFSWVKPDVILFQPPPDDTFTFPVPAAAVGLTVLAQGANIWFDTFGFTNTFQVTHGLSISVL